MKYIFVFSALIVFGAADISLKNNPPYNPSGWRPSGPLPGEYGAPPAPASVQVSQENLQFAGQVVEVTTAAEPNNAYLPPASFTAAPQQFGRLSAAQTQQSNNDFLRVQNVPRTTPPKPFRFAGQLKQLNTGEVFLVPPQTSPLQFRAQLRAPNRDGQRPFVGSTPFFSPAPLSQQQTLFARQQQLPLPETAYGAPADPNNQYGPPPAPQFPPESEIDIETETEEAATEDTTTDDPVIAIANAGTNGQYYILGKDNTLQRVVYSTTQTEDDRVHDGFTAQLRYEPVEPIRDPVYAYDAQGQLVRIYNKK